MASDRRYGTATRLIRLLALALLLTTAPAPLAARPQKDKALCKQVQQAVRAGHTLDQIMAEFGVGVQQVMQCVQTKGKRRKQKAPTTAASTRAASAASRSSPSSGGKACR